MFNSVANASSSYDFKSNVDVSNLWEDLNLGNLLNNESNILQDVVTSHIQQSTCPNSMARERHKKMVEKPTFGVLMDRYQALPSDPIAIQPKSIDRLADPIRGRFTKYDELIEEVPIGHPPIGYESPYRGSSRVNSPEQIGKSISPSRVSFGQNLDKILTNNSAKKEKKQIDSFFLTGEGENADDDSIEQYHNNNANNSRDLQKKQEVYERVKEILSPKRPLSPGSKSMLTANKLVSGIDLSQFPKAALPAQDPLIKALKKSLRQKGPVNRQAARNNNNSKAKTTAPNKRGDKGGVGRDSKSKFTLNGIEARKERKGGKMLHATLIKPLEKNKSEAKMKSRQAWNDRIVPTEVLHTKGNSNNNNNTTNGKNNLRREYQTTSKNREKISKRPSDCPPISATDYVVNKIDDVLGTNKVRKTGKLPPFPAKDNNNVIGGRRGRGTAVAAISDSENEMDAQNRILERCKSSTQLRVERISKYTERLGNRNAAYKEGATSDLEDGIDRLTNSKAGKGNNSNNNSRLGGGNHRSGGVRSAPSLLSGLTRVDENPLDRYKKLPNIPPAAVATTTATTTSSVKRRLVSDILSSQQQQQQHHQHGDVLESDLLTSDDNNAPNRYRNSRNNHKSEDVIKIAHKKPNRVVIAETNQQLLDSGTAVNETNSSADNQNVNSNIDNTDTAQFNRDMLRKFVAMDSQLARAMSPIESSGDIPYYGNDGIPVSSSDIDQHPNYFLDASGNRRSTSEIVSSLEKISKSKAERRIDSGKPKATKGTTAGTAEIEKETDEKQVERLLKFSKRFENRIAAAESLSAEYKKLSSGGIA